MEGFLLTHRGLEEVAKLEVDEILKIKAKIEQGGVSFSVKKMEELAKLCYIAQSAKRILIYFGRFKVGKFDTTILEIEKLLEKGFKIKEVQPLLKESFSMECERLGEHDFNSADIQEELSEWTRTQLKLKTEYKNPFFNIFISIDGNLGHVGLDISGKDLSKRKYKVYNYGSSVKGTIAYGLLRLGGFSKEKTLLDPFCNTGTIPIEAQLFQESISPWYYDRNFLFKKYIEFDFTKFDRKKGKPSKNIFATEVKQKYTSAAKKNATVAGVSLQMSRVDIEWLDTKFEKESVDLIVTKPLVPSKIIDEKRAEKLYKDFYYNADFIMKKTGVIVFVTEKKELLVKVGEQYKFKVARELEIEAGHINYTVLIMKRGGQHAM